VSQYYLNQYRIGAILPTSRKEHPGTRFATEQRTMSFSLNRKTEYALVALARLAEQAAGRIPVSAREIAEGYRLPVPVMTNVMKDMQRAGLIDSVRGAGGGYHLARPLERITLAEVIESIEGPVHLTLCCEAEDEPHEHEEEEPCPACRVLQNCTITSSMRQFNDLIVGTLRGITLEDLVAGRLQVTLKHTKRTNPSRSNGRARRNGKRATVSTA
jgi:Rrf2 family protein